MPGRKIDLVDNEIYHIYNRGSERREIFSQPRDFKRFIQTIYYYQFLGPKPKFSNFTKSQLNLFNLDPSKKCAEVLCYCLMPNHIHLLTKQLKKGGISKFMSQLSNSYTKYFNTKYNRVGSLFQGTFKAVRIETDEQLLHTSRYIHINPTTSGLCKRPESYSWSSYQEYLNGKGVICSTAQVLNSFPSNKYKDFIDDQIAHGATLEVLKHQTLD